jgi:predicted component of type VI protein secretion system
MIKMAVRLGGRTIETYNFSDQEIKIGRDSQGDVFLDNPAISRHHATLWMHESKLTLRDEGSANGTFLNGTQVSEPMQVKNGDSISVGKFQIIVGFTDPTKEKPTLNYGGGTLAIDMSTVQGLRDAEKEVSEEVSEEVMAPEPEPEPQPRPQAAPAPTAVKAPDLRTATNTQMFTKSMVKEKSPIPYILIGLLVGAAIGFVAGLLYGQSMNDNKPASSLSPEE